MTDLAGGPPPVFLCQAAGGQSGDGLGWTRICRHRPLPLWDGTACSWEPEGGLAASCPDPGELSSVWGEFESFRESSAQPGFSLPLELERPPELQPPGTPSAPKELGSPRPHQGGSWVTGTAADPSSEPVFGSEDTFRFAFPQVAVEQGTSDVPALDHFLDTSSEESPGLASAPRLCSESRRLWRALQSTGTVPTSRCLWSDSRCQQNLFVVLGINAAQKSLPQTQGRVLEGSGLREPEDLLAVSSFRLHHCKALIQTKLAGTPSSGQGSLITYSLFLKTPLHGSGRYITVPQKKKIFTPRNLKVAFFNKDIC